MSTSHATPRATLLSSTFFTLLPSSYALILTRWSKIASLHVSAKSDPIPSERAGAVSTLSSQLQLLSHEIEEYRALVNGIDVTDLAGIYVCAGSEKGVALAMAKSDLEDVEASLGVLEGRIDEVRAGIAYGFDKDEGGGEE
jgi:hypothetical protein